MDDLLCLDVMIVITCRTGQSPTQSKQVIAGHGSISFTKNNYCPCDSLRWIQAAAMKRLADIGFAPWSVVTVMGVGRKFFKRGKLTEIYF